MRNVLLKDSAEGAEAVKALRKAGPRALISRLFLEAAAKNAELVER